MKGFLKVMKALSDPSRIKIVKMLQHKTLCVCEIQAALALSQSTVSSHLRILEDAGLVSFEKDGLWANYSLGNGNSSPYASCLLANIKHWLDDEPEIKQIIEQLPGIKREDICKR
jgi:ArsR family transcriptional regulator